LEFRLFYGPVFVNDSKRYRGIRAACTAPPLVIALFSTLAASVCISSWPRCSCAVVSWVWTFN